MDTFSICTVYDWNKKFKKQEQETAISDLESGKIIVCPQLAFNIHAYEKTLFIPYLIKKKTKNIGFHSKNNCLKGIKTDRRHRLQLKALLAHFSKRAHYFMNALFSRYAHSLTLGHTHFHPIQIKNRTISVRRDDRLFHIDAFASNPNQGCRIIRLFCNINPYGERHIWRIGENFEAIAQRFLPKIRKPFPGSAQFLHWLGITKSIRTDYDHIMLKIHDTMKLDTIYQKKVNYKELRFPPDTTWIASTDQVSHAVISGQYLLEQTFYLPIKAMANPQRAPLHILEKLVGRHLI